MCWHWHVPACGVCGNLSYTFIDGVFGGKNSPNPPTLLQDHNQMTHIIPVNEGYLIGLFSNSAEI